MESFLSGVESAYDLSGSNTATQATDLFKLPAQSDPAWYNSPFASGLMQTIAAVGTGYIAKRADVDIQQRIAGTMPYPQQWGQGGPIMYAEAGTVNRYGQRQPVAGALGGGNLLPWLLIGAAVYFVARRK